MRPDDPIDSGGDERYESSGSEEPAEHEIPSAATWAGRQHARRGDPDGEAEPAAGESVEGEGAREAVEGESEGPEGEADGGAGAEGRDAAPEAAGDEGTDDAAVPEAEGGEGADATPDEGAEQAASQDTAEADTLALVDREEAEEAALAGLKARAAEYAAKREAKAHPAPAEGAEQGPSGSEPATPADAPEAAVTTDSAGDAPRPRTLWTRFLAASLLIVISTATATSVSLLLVLTDLARGLGGIPGIERQLAPVGGGDPQNLLILGSDERHGEGGDEDGARSDTVILLRVDPSRNAIGLLSIPRDLKVNIPGVGVDKFNAAYSRGGPKLTLRVVKQLTGLDINHVVNIDFSGFAFAVSAIDCVYVDVDRRYFIPPETGVAAIDLEAGYQRLCGRKALDYVRYRHDDNDLVRAARQQDFLREARQKIPPSKLWSDRKELLDIFKEYTTSDHALEDPIQLLELLKTFLAARNATVNEIHFPAELGGPRDPYVTANQGQIKKTVNEFLGVEGTPGPKPGSAPSKKGGKRRDGGQGQPEPAPPMVDAPTVRDYAQIIADTTNARGERRIDFPIHYPAEVPARTGLNPIDASRAYRIAGPSERVYKAYKLVFGIPGSGGFTEYWGVSGTDWVNPPILENPSEVREIDGREYMLFYDGDRLRQVGWKQRRASYWINNTLLQSLDEREMLAIARSMRALGD